MTTANELYDCGMRGSAREDGGVSTPTGSGRRGQRELEKKRTENRTNVSRASREITVGTSRTAESWAEGKAANSAGKKVQLALNDRLGSVVDQLAWSAYSESAESNRAEIESGWSPGTGRR